MPAIKRIAVIGFGEVGQIFAPDLAQQGRPVTVYDILWEDARVRESLWEKVRAAELHVAATLAEAMGPADLVISAVTASAALQVAKQAAASLHRGQIYMDLNSVSPDTKKDIGSTINATGADFVEAAVIAAVKPTRLKTPILLGGKRAQELERELAALGMSATAISDQLGVASAIKMCRSVVMKGLAALTLESLLAARRFGAEDAVIASFERTYPGMGWGQGLADALARRAVGHSARRASEMREVVATLQAKDLNSGMSAATAEWQDWLTRELQARKFAGGKDDGFTWRALADLLAQPLKTEEGA